MAVTKSIPERTDPIGWDGVQQAVSQLGIDDLWCSQYFECRLGEGDQRVDYLLAMSRGAASVAMSSFGEYIGGPGIQRRAAWLPLVSLLESWASGRSLLSERSPAIWLEFDDPRSSALVPPIPSVSVCLVPDYRDDRLVPSRDIARDLRLVRETLTTLGEPPPAALDQAISDSFLRLPPGAQWIHLSVMLGRAGRDIKLYGKLTRSQLLPYLRDIGWAGAEGDIVRAMEQFYSPALVGDDIFIDLNLSNFRDPAHCSLGLAVAQQHLSSGPDNDPRRTSTLDCWTAGGLASLEKAAAVQAWPTPRVRVERYGPWRQRSVRFLDLKLVWQSGAGLTAKAYLGSRRWQTLF
jgi:hypothetical protein